MFFFNKEINIYTKDKNIMNFINIGISIPINFLRQIIICLIK